jgi:type IV pilus assembly protein PilW
MPSRLIPVMRRPRGVGLVELMVGLTAGLVLLGALAYLFLGSRQLNRTQGDVSRMQESGRVALEILGRSLRQAGASNADKGFTGDALTATEGASGTPDAITIRYIAQEGGEVNCLGNTIAAGETVTFAFAVDTTYKTLTCTDGAVPASPCVLPDCAVVMDNVENMQITYGIDSTKDGAIDKAYQSATGLTPVQAAAARVSLLVSGPTTGIAATKSQTYSYDNASVTKTDGLLRQVYTTTFTLRNQAK